VKAILEEKGITVTEFENKLGIAKGSFYKWKNHAPSIETAKKAAEFLGVSLDDIV